MRARLLFLAALALPAAGCFPHHYHHHHGGDDAVEDACLLTSCLADACIVNTCLEPHHEYREQRYEHHHGPGCGCPQRWENGRVLFWYGGHWEYSDGATCPY